MAPLIQQIASSIPAEFRLPEEIRLHFKDGINFLSYPFSLLIVVLSWHKRKGNIFGYIKDKTSSPEVRNHFVLL